MCSTLVPSTRCARTRRKRCWAPTGSLQQTGRWALKLEGSDQPVHLLEANLQLAEVLGPAADRAPEAHGPTADTKDATTGQVAPLLAPTQPAAWEQLKDRGNAAFKSADSNPEQTLVALGLYRQAMALGPPPQGVALLHNNSAAVRLHMGEYKLALRHCEDVLAIDPDNLKALFRAAKAAKGLDKMEDALRHCCRGLELRPRDASLLALREEISAIASTRPQWLSPRRLSWWCPRHAGRGVLARAMRLLRSSR